MPIQVACTSCAGRFRVPDNVAGKKIRCPKCKEVITVPAGDVAEIAPPATAPAKAAPPKPKAPAAAAAASDNWSLKTEDGEVYGPVPRAELNDWYAEGRVTVDCQVLREGIGEWQPASDLYPELDPTPDEPTEPAPIAVVKPTPKAPAAPAAPVVEKPAAKEPSAPKPAAAKTPAAPVKTTAPQAPASPKAAAKPTTPAKPTPAKPAEQAAPKPAMSFLPPHEPEEGPAGDDGPNPFDFLGGGIGGGGGGHGHGGGGGVDLFSGGGAPAGDADEEAFSFAPAASSTPSVTPIKPGASKAIAKTTAKSTKVSATGEPGEISDKKKIVAGLLAIFLGSVGAHRFYLGYTMIGILQLITCGACGFWQLIDVFLIFTRSLPDAKGRPLNE
jgi:predicted Zn finger-like uncharacterized protein